MLLLFVVFTAQSQEYFARSFNTILTEHDSVRANTFIEFNTFGTTDIVLHMGEGTPFRYEQLSEVSEEEGHQAVKVVDTASKRVYIVLLYDDGDCAFLDVKSERILFFTNKDPEPDYTTF